MADAQPMELLDAGIGVLIQPPDLDGFREWNRQKPKGMIDKQMTEAEAGDGIANATTGYGVGNWYAYTGLPKQAEEVLRNVLKSPQWAAFGYIAAEADIGRLER